MGVYKRGDIFWIDYYDHGQRIREAVSGSRRDAEAALRDRRTDIDRGVFHRIAKKERITFEDMIEKYKAEKADKRSLKRDELSFKYLLPAFQFRYLDQITTKDIEAYKKNRRMDLKKTKRAKNSKVQPMQISGATVNREMALLKCLFNVAIQMNHLIRNPVMAVKFFPESGKRGDRVLSGLEYEQIRAAAAPHFQPIFDVAFFTGLRKGDILNLRPSDIDFDKGIIQVMMLKTADPVVIPIHPYLEPILRQAIGAAGPDAPFVFMSFRPKRDGSISKIGDIKNAFRGALKRAGLADKGYCFHDLRRTFASILYSKGVPLLTISKLLGHRSVQTTERYLNVKLEEKRQAVDMLGEAFGRGSDQLLPTVTIRSQETESGPASRSLPS